MIVSDNNGIVGHKRVLTMDQVDWATDLYYHYTTFIILKM